MYNYILIKTLNKKDKNKNKGRKESEKNDIDLYFTHTQKLIELI